MHKALFQKQFKSNTLELSYWIKCLLHRCDLGVCKVPEVCFEKGLSENYSANQWHQLNSADEGMTAVFCRDL